ncbi:MAG: FGGY-family carbohydrate kinase [Planctomycetota bacterium]|nr:FGGY-family carbohydrate kinase [Planctomycetota bacterium]
MSLLGLDVGTTGCKAVAFDLEGNVLASAYLEYPLLHPQPGWSELDSRGLWQKVTVLLQTVNRQVEADPVRALSVSCQGEAVTAVDATGQPLCNFSVSFDLRTVQQSKWWREHFGAERLFKITGMPLHAMYSINKIMWYRQNRPDMFAKAVKFLCVEDFVSFKLTGRYVIDWSLAGRTMAFDVVNKRWSDEILQAAGIDKNLLPEPCASSSVIGHVLPDLSRELGFQGEVVVAAGGHDQPCGALGAGIIEPGIAMKATGTSDAICPAFAKPILSEKMLSGNYSCYPHVEPQQYVSIAFNLTGGLLLRWYRDTLCGVETARAAESERDAYDIIVEEASDEIRSLFFLPHFVGSGTPYLDSGSRGALVGLTIDTTRQDISKAVLDSTNYEMKLNIDKMNDAGLGIRQLRAVGGGARSRRWLQMKADTFEMPVCSMRTPEAASLGAAMLAGVSVGCFKNIRDAVEAMVHIERTYHPNKEQSRRYREKYLQYRRLYRCLRSFNHLITEN